ncbi:MAG UNVERIFIED_CONTAM: hypothetical protein LVT10_00945 [Anaerolineae bacterium]
MGQPALATGVDRPDCSTTPHNTVVLQSQPNIRSTLTVNGVIVDLVGTMAVRTLDTSTVFIALSGQSSLTVLGSRATRVGGATNHRWVSGGQLCPTAGGATKHVLARARTHRKLAHRLARSTDLDSSTRLPRHRRDGQLARRALH